MPAFTYNIDNDAGVNFLDTIAWSLSTRFETHLLLLEVSLQRSKLFPLSRRLLVAMLSGLNLAEFEMSLELHWHLNFTSDMPHEIIKIKIWLSKSLKIV